MTTTTMNFEEVQIRSFEVRATSDSEARELTGIAVPYDTEIQLWDGYFEKFAPGSIEDAAAILRYGHREPLGVILTREEAAEGRRITAKVSRTQRGDEVMTLLRDGVLSKMSIGFYGIEHTETTRDDGTTLITWTKVEAREYSIVEFPAYETAEIESVRSLPAKETPMSDSTVTLDELRTEFQSSHDELKREIGLLRESRTDAGDSPIPFTFRSFGAYLKALAGQSGEAAKTMADRAYTGSVIGDAIARPAWLGSIEKRMTAKQVVCEMFQHTYDLPAAGMTVEYGVRKTPSTVKVDKQAKEGDNLKAGKTGSYEVMSAAVDTYGGYGEMSIQAIERATESLLDDLLYDQAFEYATQIETAARTLFTTTVTTNEASPVTSLTGALTVNGMIDTVLALSDAYDDTPYLMDGIAVSKDVFVELAKLNEEKKALAFTGTPTDKVGTLTVPNGEGELITVRVKRVPLWTGRHMTGWAKEAIKVRESAGAPLRLQQENIINLTKGFAVYGYAAIFAPKTDLIKAVKLG